MEESGQGFEDYPELDLALPRRLQSVSAADLVRFREERGLPLWREAVERVARLQGALGAMMGAAPLRRGPGEGRALPTIEQVRHVLPRQREAQWVPWSTKTVHVWISSGLASQRVRVAEVMAVLRVWPLGWADVLGEWEDDGGPGPWGREVLERAALQGARRVVELAELPAAQRRGAFDAAAQGLEQSYVQLREAIFERVAPGPYRLDQLPQLLGWGRYRVSSAARAALRGDRPLTVVQLYQLCRLYDGLGAEVLPILEQSAALGAAAAR